MRVINKRNETYLYAWLPAYDRKIARGAVWRKLDDTREYGKVSFVP
jgi:hypothetical protein